MQGALTSLRSDCWIKILPVNHNHRYVFWLSMEDGFEYLNLTVGCQYIAASWLQCDNWEAISFSQQEEVIRLCHCTANLLQKRRKRRKVVSCFVLPLLAFYLPTSLLWTKEGQKGNHKGGACALFLALYDTNWPTDNMPPICPRVWPNYPQFQAWKRFGEGARTSWTVGVGGFLTPQGKLWR